MLRIDISQSEQDELAEIISKTNFPQGAGFPPLSIGVSGGADSMCLMLLSAAFRLDVDVIHVDHGMRENTEYEKQLVVEIAKELGMSYRYHSGFVDPDGGNVEAKARELRHSFFDEGTMTGHTMDDLAETVLMNVGRGCHINGLRGIKKSWRKPILGLRRSETERVCEIFGVEPFTDPSNAEPIYRRNRVRNELVPLLDDIFDKDIVEELNRLSIKASIISDFVDGSIDRLGEDLFSVKKIRHDLDHFTATYVVSKWLTKLRQEFEPEHQYSPNTRSTESVYTMIRTNGSPVMVEGGYRISIKGDLIKADKP